VITLHDIHLIVFYRASKNVNKKLIKKIVGDKLYTYVHTIYKQNDFFNYKIILHNDIALII